MLLLALSLLALPAAGQATITVDTTGDTAATDGSCTLREAITNANSNSDTTGGDCAAGTNTGTDTIEFNIPGAGVHTISPGSALPVITDRVVLDGETQGAAVCGSTIASRTLTVVLDGSAAAGSGLELGAGSDGSTIQGLVISQWPVHGVWILGSDNNVVACNFIGTDDTGTADLGNTLDGVRIDGGVMGNTIGGTAAGAGNVISGNDDHGVFIDASDNNTVLGNFIGTDITGTAGLGNGSDAVRIDGGARGNTIGGTATGARNVISGNENHGVFFGDVVAGVFIEGSDNNSVLGNFIGTDVTGTANLGNAGYGVIISESRGNTIGGTATGARNVISGNNESGVVISGSHNNVLGNFIGTDVTGTADLGNAEHGVVIAPTPGTKDNTIGGTAAGAGNVISGNDDHGVLIYGGDNTVLGNFIGTDVTGTAVLGNSGRGVFINGGGGVGDNTIGGTATGARNVISGNKISGLTIFASDKNKVLGNFIGTDVTGTADLGNNARGVGISGGATGNTIGGRAVGAGNTIAFNGLDGIAITDLTTTGNALRANATFQNGGLGIDLGDNHPTRNDPGDGDGGPNNFQNFPTITSAIDGSGDLIITYLVDTAPAYAAYNLTVEFFEADGSDEEGQTLLGSDTYTTTDYSGCGTAPCEKTVNLGGATGLGVSPDESVVATATDGEGNTSEFSPSAVVSQDDAVATEPGGEAPVGFHLSAAHPNPFTGQATLVLTLERPQHVRAALYDVVGREIAVLVERRLQVGSTALQLDGMGLPAGVYYVRAASERTSWVRTVVLVK